MESSGARFTRASQISVAVGLQLTGTQIGKSLFRIGLALGWQDIRQSYRRSALGQLWITIGMAVTIATIGFVFGIIFGTPLHTFLPYLTSGIILWGLLSGILNEGAQSFIAAERMIKQIPLPKLTYLIRVVWRNLLTSCHNIIIFPIVLLAVNTSVNWKILLFPLGLAVAVMSISGLSLILAIVSTRYRDVPPIVNSVVTISFYVTPVIWMSDSLGNNQLAHLLLGLNPFYHLLQIARLPLLGELPTAENWGLALLSVGVFWSLGLVMYRKFENRITYWV